MQCETKTTCQSWQRVAEIHDVALIDVTIVIDIFVDCITALEVITGISLRLIAESHLYGITLGILYIVARGTYCNRICLAGIDILLKNIGAVGLICTSYITCCVIVVLIDAFAAETIYRAEWVVELHALKHGTVTFGPVAVKGLLLAKLM